MHLTAKHRIAILLHQGIRGDRGKTGLAFLRYSEGDIVAVIDAQSAGESLIQLTGIDKDVPIVASVSEVLTYNPDVLLIGIAPSGGKLPLAWQEEIDSRDCCGNVSSQWVTHSHSTKILLIYSQDNGFGTFAKNHQD